MSYLFFAICQVTDSRNKLLQDKFVIVPTNFLGETADQAQNVKYLDLPNDNDI